MMQITRPARWVWVLAALFGLSQAAELFASEQRQLGAPVFDNASETTFRQVKWTDFKGGGQKPPGWNRWQRGSFAHILCYMKVGAYKFEARREGEEWVVVPVGIRPYAIMDKFHSAVKPGSRNDVALAHEQIHFDIAELMARRLAVDLVGLEGRGQVEQAARVNLEHQIKARFQQGEEELQQMQASYDGETSNSQNRKKQKKWAAKVEEMFRQATVDLRKVLGSAPAVE